MPELPEVELTRRALLRWFDGAQLQRTSTDAPARIFRDSAPGAFAALQGPLVDIHRRGKYLVFRFEDGKGLMAHLGMTGRFLRRRGETPVAHSRAQFHLSTGDTVHFVDPRMFGRLLARSHAEIKVEQIGIDPIIDGLSVSALKAALSSTKQALKVALLDQSRVAGLGNLWVVEALFLAKLHPARKPSSLDEREWRALHTAIMRTLRRALTAKEDGDDVFFAEDDEARFRVYDREGEPCTVCRRKIARIVQGGRATFFCPGCQPKSTRTKPARLPAKSRRTKVRKG